MSEEWWFTRRTGRTETAITIGTGRSVERWNELLFSAQSDRNHYKRMVCRIRRRLRKGNHECRLSCTVHQCQDWPDILGTTEHFMRRYLRKYLDLIHFVLIVYLLSSLFFILLYWLSKLWKYIHQKRHPLKTGRHSKRNPCLLLNQLFWDCGSLLGFRSLPSRCWLRLLW